MKYRESLGVISLFSCSNFVDVCQQNPLPSND